MRLFLSFTVASYNVLASAYIQRAAYPRSPALVLDPIWRIPSLAQHLSSHLNDFFCLQEVETETLGAVRARLTHLGYADYYARKRGKPDGCAIFYRPALFNLIGIRTIYFGDGAAGARDSGNVALVATFRGAGRILGVIDTHLTWDPPGTPVQARVGLRQARQLLNEWEKLADTAQAWIIAGDLNVTPDDEMVTLIESAGFAFAHRDYSGANTCNFAGQAKMIDYLFHSAALRAEPAAIAPVDGRTILPSAEKPSDHVIVAAQFDWTL